MEATEKTARNFFMIAANIRPSATQIISDFAVDHPLAKNTSKFSNKSIGFQTLYEQIVSLALRVGGEYPSSSESTPQIPSALMLLDSLLDRLLTRLFGGRIFAIIIGLAGRVVQRR